MYMQELKITEPTLLERYHQLLAAEAIANGGDGVAALV